MPLGLDVSHLFLHRDATSERPIEATVHPCAYYP